jgi:acyl carrier protein
MLVGIKETIESRVLNALHVDYPQAKLDQNFVSIGMDSLDYLEFIVKVEIEFAFEIAKDTLFSTPRELVQHLEANCNTK